MGSQVGIEFGSKCIHLFFNFFLFKLLLLKFKLQLETLYLDLSFPFMIQNALVWFTMFWRGHVPSRRTILPSFV